MLVFRSETFQGSRDLLEKYKSIFNRLGLSDIYPVIKKMVNNEFVNKNLTQTNAFDNLLFIHSEMKTVLGIMNVPKRSFKLNVNVLVKRLLMDLRQIVHFTNWSKQIKGPSNCNTDKLIEEITTMFDTVDVNFNNVVTQLACEVKGSMVE